MLSALRNQGADFLGGIARRTALTPPQALEALWERDMAGAGHQRYLRPAPAGAQGQEGPCSGWSAPSLQGGTGRWSLTARLAGPAPDAAKAFTTLLLGRYGVVTRESPQAEEAPVPWRQVYNLLTMLELRGEVRHGYFSAGLSGTQFALPEAVERLRAIRKALDGAPGLMAACNPANPYGAMLPPPEGARIARLAST